MFVWCAGAKDKKGKAAAGKVGYDDDDDDGRPRALQVDLAVRLCSLHTCDTDTRHTAAAAAAAGDAAADWTSSRMHRGGLLDSNVYFPAWSQWPEWFVIVTKYTGWVKKSKLSCCNRYFKC